MFKKRKAKDQQTLNLEVQLKQSRQTPRNQFIDEDQDESVGKDHNEKDENDYKTDEQELEARKQPRKKVKTQFIKNLITSNNQERLNENEQQIHKEFKSLNYSAAGKGALEDDHLGNLKQNMKLEEELAKEKYMENIQATKQVKEGKRDTSVYRGMNSYANYALNEDQIVNAQEKFRKIAGPSRVNSTIRNTCRFDYNFGLCKDWKDSGYCPFGNSCIYLHDRSNYKTGWEQEKDFERAEKERWRRINNPELALKEEIEESLKAIEKYKVDENCTKCQNAFVSPVQIDCGHIFCTKCALKLDKCLICKKKLCGIMNNAEKKLEKMKSGYEEMKEKIFKQNEDKKVKRKQHEDTCSLDVFGVCD